MKQFIKNNLFTIIFGFFGHIILAGMLLDLVVPAKALIWYGVLGILLTIVSWIEHQGG